MRTLNIKIDMGDVAVSTPEQMEAALASLKINFEDSLVDKGNLDRVLAPFGSVRDEVGEIVGTWKVTSDVTSKRNVPAKKKRRK